MTCIRHQQVVRCIFPPYLYPAVLYHQANAIYLELERMGESFEQLCCTMNVQTQPPV